MSKLCEQCGCPMLKRGQRRRDPNSYRHARGCPNASKREAAQTEALWARLDAEGKAGAAEVRARYEATKRAARVDRGAAR